LDYLPLTMKIAAIIAAAGIGRRMGGDVPKQYLELAGRPIICHTLDLFKSIPGIDEVVVVVEPGRELGFREDIIDKYGYPSSWSVVGGGSVRQESVANGLNAVSESCEIVIVHDGVRPFVMQSKIEELVRVASSEGACILAAPVKETIKRVDNGAFVLETVDRGELWGVQTPQVFRRGVLAGAIEEAARSGFVGTDEASLVERIGVKVKVVEGDYHNIKITTPEDIGIAEGILTRLNV
jgi:2-C-methyl-D-erythritol 4-phosphate cytidylyltransferase